jgi:tripartite motif-containing protein 71
MLRWPGTAYRLWAALIAVVLVAVIVFGAYRFWFASSAAVLSAPHGVALHSGGSLLVANTGRSQIVVFSRSGKVTGRWSTAAGGHPGLRYPSAIATDGYGRVYVANYFAGQPDSLQLWSAHGTFLRGTQVAGGGVMLQSLAVGPDGTVWLAMEGSDPNLEAFDSNLRRIHPWGSRQLVGCARVQGRDTIAVSPDGPLYAAETECGDIREYAPNGRLLRTFGHGRFTVPDGPAAITVGLDGIVYIVDQNAHRIVRFRTNGQPLPAWSVPDIPSATTRSATTHDPSTLGSPGIAVDRASNVYLTAAGHILKLNAHGHVVDRWG